MVSELSCKTILSPCRSKRTASIKYVIIHCMAGNLTIERCGALFQKASRQCSSNYGIGSDGRIGCYVPEEYRSWCSSSFDADNNGISIEVANNGGAPDWPISNEAMESLVALLVDICRRYNIVLKWSNNKTERVKHLNGVTMLAHRDYARKACPGDYIYNREAEIAAMVNAIIAGSPYIYDGLDYSPVFDSEYYCAKYDDLMHVFGHDKRALFQHFISYGMDELRQGCADFDPIAYKSKNEDLRAAFGDNNAAYYQHYILCGKKEIADGRRAPFM